MNLSNKTFLITGSNRGIGRALVTEALARGAKTVYAAMRTPEPSTDPRVVPIRLDITDRVQIQQAVARVPALDVLINNAGIAGYDNLGNPEVLEEHLKVNLVGTYQTTLAFLPLLKASRGAVVNNLSILAIAPMPLIPSYSISKAALSNLTQSLRGLLKAQSIAVHGVFLGPVDTDMNRGVDIPKDSPGSAAKGIFAGIEAGEEDIFPDTLVRTLSAGWKNGVAKALEAQNQAFLAAATSPV